MLSEIPGIENLAIYIEDTLISTSKNRAKVIHDWPPSWELAQEMLSINGSLKHSNYHQFSIQTPKANHGKLLILVSDNSHFSTYRPFIENTVNHVALVLENWKNEEELKQEKEFLKAVLDNVEDGIVACDKTGTLTLFNKATRKMHNLLEKPIPAEQWAKHYDLYHADGKTMMDTQDIPLYRALQGEYIRNLEMVIAPKDSSMRYVLASGQPLQDLSGQIIGAVASLHDITERKRAEDALRRAHDNLEKKVEERTNDLRQSRDRLENEVHERKRIEAQLRQSHKMEAIGTLAGGIAHDFNNILAAIIGYTDMAKDDLPSYSPAKHHLEEVLKASSRAKDLVKQILSFSRKEDEERIPVNLHILVKEALVLLRATIPTTIDIRTDIDPHCGQILAEPTQIHQIIMNICTNAAQAMGATGGIIEIQLDCYEVDKHTFSPELSPGNYLRLSIHDNGPGIPKELSDRIFDPYFTTKDVGEGSGMGLAVVAGIINSHEGHIEVTSNNDSGASFFIYFPKIDQQEATENNTEKELPTGKGERILIVDDDPTIANMTARRIELLGYDVVSRTNSQEALELFQMHPDSYDLIITDQTMPGLTGDQLVRNIKTIRNDIPIIICTGYSAQMNAAIAAQQGIDTYLLKPIDKFELAHSIRSLLKDKAA